MLRSIGVGFLLLAVAACAAAPVASPPESAKAPKQPIGPMLTAADAARADGHFAEAMQIYQEVLVSEPKTTAAEMGVAECLLGAEKADEARKMFEALVAVPGQHAAALQGEGLALLALKKRDLAGKALTAAVEEDPKLWRAWNGLGLIADMQRDPVEAYNAYQHALAINPDSVILHNNVGYSRLLAGKPDEAIAEFRKALALDPSSDTVQTNYRLAIAAKGNYAEALRGADQDKLPDLLNNVGYVAMQRGDLTAAEGYFARAMEDSTSYNVVVAQNIEQLKAKKGTQH